MFSTGAQSMYKYVFKSLHAWRRLSLVFSYILVIGNKNCFLSKLVSCFVVVLGLFFLNLRSTVVLSDTGKLLSCVVSGCVSQYACLFTFLCVYAMILELFSMSIH